MAPVWLMMRALKIRDRLARLPVNTAAFVSGATPLVVRAPTSTGDAVELFVRDFHALLLGKLEQFFGGVACARLLLQLCEISLVFMLLSLLLRCAHFGYANYKGR